MDAKRIVAALLTSWVAVGWVSAQEPIQASPPVVISSPVLTTTGSPVPPMAPGTYDVPGVSNWVRRGTPCCDGPVGKNGEIGTELYIRSGISIPLGTGEILSRNLGLGFVVQGGARTLFFNHAFDRAWVIDASLSYSSSGNSDRQPPEVINTFIQTQGVPIGNADVTIRGFDRGFLSLGGGREWFLGSALDRGGLCRFGADGGFRIGSGGIGLDRVLTYKTDVIGGAYIGGHAKYEFLFCESLVTAGLRTEYAYTWSDILQRATDLQELNILFSLGVRY